MNSEIVKPAPVVQPPTIIRLELSIDEFKIITEWGGQAIPGRLFAGDPQRLDLNGRLYEDLLDLRDQL